MTFGFASLPQVRIFHLVLPLYPKAILCIASFGTLVILVTHLKYASFFLQIIPTEIL